MTAQRPLTANNTVRLDALNLIEAVGRRDSEATAQITALYIDAVSDEDAGRLALDLVWHLAEMAAYALHSTEGRDRRLALLRALMLTDKAQELDAAGCWWALDDEGQAS